MRNTELEETIIRILNCSFRRATQLAGTEKHFDFSESDSEAFDERTDWEEQRDESREQRLSEEGGFNDPSFF